MRDTSTGASYTVDQFIGDVKAILSDKGATNAGLQAIAAKMEVLSRRDDLFDLGEYRPPTPGGNTTGSYRLHAEPDNTLMLSVSRFSQERPTPVHNHDSWGVICGYQGRDCYIQYDRTDQGGKEGHAELKEVINTILTRGKTVWWEGSPHDIHVQQALDDQPSWEIILMGKSTRGIERLHFDPENQKVWLAQRP